MGYTKVGKKRPEIALKNVRKNGIQLKFVTNQFEELCLEAVQQNGRALQHVKNQTSKICIAAVKQNGRALEFVQTQTQQLVLLAISQNPNALEYVDDEFITLQLCLQCVMNDPKTIKHVPRKFQGACKATLAGPFLEVGRAENTDLKIFVRLMYDHEKKAYVKRYFISGNRTMKNEESWDLSHECHNLGLSAEKYEKICNAHNSKKNDTGELYFTKKKEAIEAAKALFKKTSYRVFISSGGLDADDVEYYVSAYPGTLVTKLKNRLEKQQNGEGRYYVKVIFRGQPITDDYEKLSEALIDRLKAVYK